MKPKRPYKEEPPTITKMHEWARAQGYELHGQHHEIYLGDPRKTEEEIDDELMGWVWEAYDLKK